MSSSFSAGLCVSVTQVKAFTRCPAFYAYKYVLGEEPAFVPVGLAFGAAIHSALEAYYREFQLEREPLPLGDVLDVFRDAWTKAEEGPVPLEVADGDEGGPNQSDVGISMLHAFYEQAHQVLGTAAVESVERTFSVTISDPQTAERLEEKLVGRIDLLLRDGDRRVIVEHKTAAKRWSEDALRHDCQPAAYRLAARALRLGEAGLRYQIITKARIPVVQIADVQRDEEDERDFLRTVVGVLRAVEAGVDYPVRGWACRSCPYAHACGTR
jgi:putative RecB family exonuclease